MGFSKNHQKTGALTLGPASLQHFALRASAEIVEVGGVCALRVKPLRLGTFRTSCEKLAEVSVVHEPVRAFRA